MTECLVGMLLTGSGAYLLWRAQYTVTGERFSARWQYRLLKLVLGFFVLPVGLLAGAALGPGAAGRPPAAVPVPPGFPAAGTAVLGPLCPTETGRAPAEREILPAVRWAGALSLLRGLWLAGALGLGGREALRYGRFRRRFLRRCVPDCRRETAAALADCLPAPRRGPTVRRAPLPCSPFVTGLVRPVIVLPPGEADRAELRYVLDHELRHIRRGDLWVRALAAAARTAFWFNPLVWRLNRQLVEWSELACDEAVTASLDREGRRRYGQVILKAALRSAEGGGPWATALAAPELMKRRLARMLRGKEMKRGTRAAAALVLAVLAAGGCALAAWTYRPAGGDPAAPVGDGEPGAGGVPSAPPESIAPPPADGARYPVDGPAQREALIASLKAAYGLQGEDFVIHINFQDGSEVVEVYRSATRLSELAAAHLVDGRWPLNGSGESYGPDCLREITGTEPDLTAAVGTDGTCGYIRRSDMWDRALGCSTPEEAKAYTEFITALGGYDIPLYNAEGQAVGRFRVGDAPAA